MRDMVNPPKKLSPGGNMVIDYEEWGKDEPPLENRPSQVKDIRDNRNPEDLGHRLLAGREAGGMVSFHEICDEVAGPADPLTQINGLHS